LHGSQVLIKYFEAIVTNFLRFIIFLDEGYLALVGDAVCNAKYPSSRKRKTKNMCVCVYIYISCTTNRRVAGSILDGVTGIFH